MSFNWWIEKATQWNITDDRKEWNSNPCYNMGETWKHYAKGKKKNRNKRPNIVGFYLYEMSRQIHKDRKWLMLPVGGGKEKGEWPLRGMEFLFEMITMF